MIRIKSIILKKFIFFQNIVKIKKNTKNYENIFTTEKNNI